MEMVTAGGVISGYWATGKLTSASPPASAMTMDTTEAKIGRSMKKRLNTRELWQDADQGSRRGLPRKGKWKSALLLLLGGWRVRLGRRGRAWNRHRVLFWIDVHSRPELLNRPDGDQLARLETFLDHPQPVVLEGPGRHPAVADLLVRIDHVDVFESLVGADGAIHDQDGRMRLADRQPDADEHARGQEPAAVRRFRV